MTGFALKTAIAGLVLGIIGGLIGRVGFPIILGRSLLSALIAAALGAGAYELVRRFLPELFSLVSAGTDDGEEVLDSGLDTQQASNGTNVNIVLGEDSDDQAQDLRDELSASQREFRESNEPVGNLFAGDENTIIEEVREDNSSSGQLGPGSGEDSFGGGVDGLPDISGFADAFSEGDFSDEDDVPPGETSPDSLGGPSLSGFDSDASFGSESSKKSGEDPKILAQAIRTALKKQ